MYNDKANREIEKKLVRFILCIRLRLHELGGSGARQELERTHLVASNHLVITIQSDQSVPRCIYHNQLMQSIRNSHRYPQ